MAHGVDEARALSQRLDGEERDRLQQEIGHGLGSVPSLSVLAMAWSRPEYGVLGTVGFVDGYCEGFIEGAAAWIADLKRLFHLVGIGTVVGMYEFLARPLIEDDPTGLSPMTKQAMTSLNAIKLLRPVIQWLDRVGPVEAVAVLRELLPTVDDIATIITRAATDWMQGLAAHAADPFATGRYVGTMMGRVELELIRAVVEPDSFAFGELLEMPLPANSGSPP